MQWLHNGEELQSSSNIRTSLSAGAAVLQILQASAANQGEYCCQATNAAGFDASKARLTVECKFLKKNFL